MTHPLCVLAASGQISPVPMSAPLSKADKRTGIYCIWMPNDPKHRVYVGQMWATRRANAAKKLAAAQA